MSGRSAVGDTGSAGGVAATSPPKADAPTTQRSIFVVMFARLFFLLYETLNDVTISCITKYGTLLIAFFAIRREDDGTLADADVRSYLQTAHCSPPRTCPSYRSTFTWP